MTNQVVLAILEIIAIGSCCFGTYYVYQESPTWFQLCYSGAWFILGFWSNFFGLVSIFYYYQEQDEELSQTQSYLQIHYLFAWLTTVIGYPTFVALTFLTHYPTNYGHILSGLAVLPIIAYYIKDNDWIVYLTQAGVGLSIVAHLYITYLADNINGMIGAGIMFLNLIALSTPTRFSVLGILSSRECFVVGLAVCSYLFALSVQVMSKKPVIVKNLIPWI